MLRCPFCETDLINTELQSGRCPGCGSVLAWEDDETESMPKRREKEVATSESPDPAESDPPPGDPPPTETGVKVSQTMPVIPPVEGTPPTDSKSGMGTRETDGPMRTLADIFEGVPGTPSVSSDSTTGDDAPGSIHKTLEGIKPRELTPDASQSMEEMWKKTISPTARPSTTVKTDELKSSETAAHKEAPRRHVRELHEPNSDRADYQLLSVIGEGGVGVVYSARQTSVDRTVAVKMLRPDVSSEWEQQQKFLSEAVVTGDLDHPNIVPVYDLGSGEDGALFYSMKRVAGTPWSDVIFDKSQEENLGILMKVADAIAFAHSRGVVHRDLKPENVMLGDYGEVLVMDWGIALPTPTFSRATSILQSGSLGGTPAYMAPEMATGPVSRIGIASDVYLLGGILFEMITGMTPHNGADVMECLQAAARNEIPHTEKTGELLNIALRSLATDPEARYETVQEFQSAIRDYQSHTESIALSSRAEDDLQQADETRDYQDFARAMFAFEEAFALWDGNHRAAMGISAAKLAYAQCAFEKNDFDLGLSLLNESEPTHQRLRGKLLVALKERDARQQRLKSMKRIAGMLVGIVFLVVSIAFVQVQIAKNDALEKKDLADQAAESLREKNTELDLTAKALVSQTKAAEKARDDAKDSAKVAKKQKDKAEEATQRAIVSKSREEILKLRTEYDKYLARIALAAEKINRNEFDDARRILEEYKDTDLSHWEWARLWFLCQRSTRDFNSHSPVESVAFSPDGKRFVSGGQDGAVRVWNVTLDKNANGDPLFTCRHSENSPVNAVAWSPDNQWIVSAGQDGRIRLWRATDGTEVPGFQTGGHTDAITSATFSYPQGNQNAKRRWLVTASRDKSVIIWDMTTLKRAHAPLIGHNWWVWDVDVSQDQKRIVTAGQDGKIVLWRVVDSADGLRIGIENRTLSAKEAAVAGRDKLPLILDGYHHGPVFSVAFSPKGDRVVSGGFDNRVLVWSPNQVHPVDLRLRLDGKSEPAPKGLQLIGHTLPVRSVQFSPDPEGRLILSCGDDNTIMVWNGETGKLQRTLRGHGSWVRSATFEPTGQNRDPVSPSDRLVLSGGYDHRVKLWPIAGYEEVRVYQSRILRAKGNEDEDEVQAAIFDANGVRLAVAGKFRGIRVWGISRKDRNRPIIIDEGSRNDYREGHEFLASTIRFFRKSPYRGRRFVSAAMDGTVRIWDVSAGAEVMPLTGTGAMGAFALSDDEKQLATGSNDSAVLLWNLPPDGTTSPTPIRLAGHAKVAVAGDKPSVTALAFSPNGAILVSGDTSGQCLVWNLKTRTLIGRLNRNAGGRRHTKQITRIVFLDDDRVATSSNDNTVAIWSAGKGTELGRMIHDDSVIAMDVSPDRQRLVTACRAATAFVSATADEEADFQLTMFNASGREIARTRIKNSTVSSVRFSPKGDRVLAVSNDGHLLDWNPSQPSAKRLWPTAAADRNMWSATIAPDDDFVLTVGGRRVRLHDRKTGAVLMTFGSHSEITRLRFTDDGDRLISGDSIGAVKIWNIATKRSEQTLSPRHQGAISAVFHSTGTSPRLITVGGPTIHCWIQDKSTGQWKLEKTLTASGMTLTGAAMSPNGQWLVTGSRDGSLQVWNIAEMKAGEKFPRVFGHAKDTAVRSLAFSHDGTWIVSGGDDKTAIIWQWNAAYRNWSAIAHLKGHPAPVNSVSISRDRYRVLTGSDDKSAKIWDTRTLVPGAIATVNSGRVEAIQRLSGNLQRLHDTLTNWSTTKTELPVDNVIRERVVTTLARVHQLIKPQMDIPLITDPKVNSMRKLVQELRDRIDPEGAYLNAAGDGNSVTVKSLLEVWKSADEWSALADAIGDLNLLTSGPQLPQEILTLTGHVRGVTAVTFSPDGRNVLTGSRDGKAVVWLAVNIAPAIRLPAGPLVFDARSRQTRIASNAIIFDPDSATFEGGQLTATLADDEGRGRLRIHGNNVPQSRIRQSGAAVEFRAANKWLTIGQVEVDADGNKLSVKFNAQASRDAVEACLRSIAYSADSNAERRATVTFELSDGEGGKSKSRTQLLIFQSPVTEPSQTTESQTRQPTM